MIRVVSHSYAPEHQEQLLAVTPSARGVWSILGIFEACGITVKGRDERPYGDPASYRF